MIDFIFIPLYVDSMTTIPLEDKLYTSTQVSEILGVSLRTLYRYMEDGRIASMRTASGRHRFTKEQILDFLTANGVGEFNPTSSNKNALSQSQVYSNYPNVGQSANQSNINNPYQQFPNNQQYSGSNAPSYNPPTQSKTDDYADDKSRQSSDEYFAGAYKGQNTDMRDQKPIYDEFPTRDYIQSTPDKKLDHNTYNTESGQQGSRPNSFDQNQWGGQYQPLKETNYNPSFYASGKDNELNKQSLDQNVNFEDEISVDGNRYGVDTPRKAVMDDFELDSFGDKSNFKDNQNEYDKFDSRATSFESPEKNVYQSTTWEETKQVEKTQVYDQSQRFNNTNYAGASAQTSTTQPTGFDKVTTNPYETTDLSADLNVRYYRSEYQDLIELAKKIKDTAISKDMEYAFTLYAGLSLHFLIKPFTILHFYANPEDMQLWKDELKLVPSQKKEDANIGIIVNTDIVFVPTKDIGGFRVVQDKVLMRDLSNHKEEELFKQFRQHLVAN